VGGVARDRELILLPSFPSCATLVVGVSFFLPIMSLSHTTAVDGRRSRRSARSSTSCSSSLRGARVRDDLLQCGARARSDERMRGGDTDLAAPRAGAWSRAAQILPWAIVSATVSLILRSIQRARWHPRPHPRRIRGHGVVARDLLVLPILVIEGLTVGKAIKRSSELFRRAWGSR